MALNRAPTAIQVNGAALLIKDPTISTGLFSKYQRVPGLANFTLPDETGSTNEVQLMDGSVAFAQIAGVGTITGSVGAISGHATHTLLAEKRRSGANVTVAIVRPALVIGDAAGQADNKVAAAANGSTGFSVVTVDDDTASIAKALLREGRLVIVSATAPASSTVWNGVLKINEDGEKFSIEPGYSSIVSKASGTKLYVRQAGFTIQDITCTVNGFGDGDFQAGAAVGANISLQPAEALPTRTRESRIITEMSTAFDGALADVA